MLSRFRAVVLIVLGSAVLGAASVPRYAGSPVAQVFTEREIPGGAAVRSILAHPNGLVYIATTDGLVEYDGTTWNIIAGTRGLIVHQVAADAHGRIWYSGTSEFGRLVPDAHGTLTAEPLHTRLPAEDRDVGHVLRMFVQDDTAYFVTQGTKGFLARADARGEVAEVPFPIGERAVAVFAHAGALHAIGTKSVYRIDGTTLQPEPDAAFLAGLGVFSVWPRAEGGAWVVSIAGLRVWNGHTAPLISNDVGQAIGDDRVSCGCPLGDGRFALGTERHGVLVIDVATGRVLSRHDDDGGLGATSSTTTALTLDADGGLWLSRFAGATRIQINTPAAKFESVRGRVQGFGFHRGKLHVATTVGVFARSPETGEFSPLPGIIGDSWVLLSTEDGLIVGGPDLRLIRDDGTVEVIEAERLLFRSAVRLRRDPERIVACTGPGLVRIYHRVDGHWRFESTLPNVRASLYPLFEDANGWLWATRNRLEIARLDFRAGLNLNAKLEFVGPALGLPLTAATRDRVQLSLIDGAAEVSGAGGLWHHDAASDRFVPENRFTGLDPARWTQAFPLDENSIWLANNRESDTPALARRTGPASWQIEPLPYTGLEAVHPTEVCADPATNTVWLGYLGLASYDRSWQGARAQPPLARLRRIAGSSENSVWNGAGDPPTASFGPGENSLRFTFAAPVLQPNIYGVAQAEYRTLLAGLDPAWSAWSTNTQRDYSHLPPGKFTFRLEARDAGGREGPEATYSFTILPPWWRTWWLLGFATLSVIGAVAGITRWFATRALQRRVALLEAQSAVERERLRLARDLHDEVGSGLGRVILFAGEATRSSDPAQQRAALDRVRDTALELVQHAREIVWAVSPQHDTLASLVERLADHVHQTLRAAGIECTVDLPAEIPAAPLGSEVRHSLFLAVKEAVHNCVKYSAAKSAWFTVRVTANRLTVTLRDDGRGFAAGERRGTGHGLRNLSLRAEALDGIAEIVSAPGQGTTITLNIPFEALPAT